MKIAVLFLLASLFAYGQATINAPAVTLDSIGSTNLLAWMGKQGTGVTQTLASDITAIATSITLVSAQGINSASVIAIGSEHVSVTSKAGNVLTVVRGANGTTPASALAGATVTEMKYKTLNALGKQIIVDSMRQIIRQQNRAALDAAAASAETAAVAAVQ